MAPQPLNMDTQATQIRKRRSYRRRRVVSSTTGAAGGVGTTTTRGSRAFNSDMLTGIHVGYSVASNINPQDALVSVQHDLSKFGWKS